MMTYKATILCIEDNPDNRLLIRRVLAVEGYQVLEAEDAHQALDILKAQSPDLILMDINMPEIDGYTLTAQLKQSGSISNVPIIALTANAMKGDREKCLEAGCDGYIQKPINIDQLPLDINNFLSAKG
jgi:two-component system cell cycle response regulator DivK